MTGDARGTLTPAFRNVQPHCGAQTSHVAKFNNDAKQGRGSELIPGQAHPAGSSECRLVSAPFTLLWT